MKISWCQADVDRWSQHFGLEVDVQSRVFLQNAESGSALSLQGGRVVGSTPSTPSSPQEAARSQVWVIVRVPTRGVLLVNEATGKHVVAKGWSEAVECDEGSIDDKRGLWEIDYVDGNMTFRSLVLDDAFLDLSYGSTVGTEEGPVFLFNGDGATCQQWKVTHLMDEDEGWDWVD